MTAPSRKGKIIAVANQFSAVLIRAAEGRPRTAENLERIRAVCQALVQRATPLRPTAKTVSEEGRNRNPTFPAEQTIFNTYPEMVQTWRRAYEDILNIDAPDPVNLDELEKIDPSLYEVGSRAVIEVLVCQVREVTRRNNALKQLISESVPTPSDDLPSNADGVMSDLSAWLARMADSGFDLDDFGLKVTSRVRPGTLVMDAVLFNELKTLTDDYELSRKARAARSDG